MADRWYLQKPNTPIEGPLGTNEILERIASGQASRDATVCPMGENRWNPIADVSEFAGAFGAATATPLPMPMPPPAKLPPPPAAALPPPRAPMASTPRSVAPPPPPAPVIPGAPMIAGLEGPPTLKRSGSSSNKMMMFAGIGVGVLVVLAGLIFIGWRVLKSGDRIKNAIVRVTTPSMAGTGFFIRGPDEFVYVATAFHVIEKGERILIERNVDISDKSYFVEAYPETEVVAVDADADIAIIRIKNLEAGRFDRLDLASEPVKDERILSYGFPVSSLVKRAGLISKDGKVLSLVKFPAYDRRYARIVRENAIAGLLVSTDIEPGFSGGPTCNEAGKVVGINVTKDTTHAGQNGAVSVTLLQDLLAKVKPVSAKAAPTPDEVAALLKQIQTDYLLLPLEERLKVRETQYLSLQELPTLRRFVADVRRQERDTAPTFLPKLRISGQAAVGIFFARLPGKSLETYLAPSSRKPILECEQNNQRLVGFLEGLGEGKVGSQSAVQAALSSCDELALRPLAWDLIGATMQWDGKEKEYAVTKVESVDDEGSAYRASVRISGYSNVVEMWVAVDQGKLGLKVFDDAENLYAIKSPKSYSGNAFTGSWIAKRPRVTDAIDKDMEVESEEELSVSIQNEREALVKHAVNHNYHIAEGTQGFFGCNQKKEIKTGLSQSFSGNVDNGVIVAVPQKDPERIGEDGVRCKPKYTADRIVAFKLVGDQLFMYRTNGIDFPEAYQFQKKQ